MDKELVWLILPICGLLSQLGGTFNKLFRRIGVPLVITIASWYWLGWSWLYFPMFLCMFGATCLPVTLKGDSIPSSWINWIWVWILGYLLGLSSVFLNSSGFMYSLVPCVICGLCVTLSNLKVTSKFFQWKFCEFLIYSAMAYPYALIISL